MPEVALVGSADVVPDDLDLADGRAASEDVTVRGAVDEPGLLQAADVGQDVALTHLTSEILKRPQRLVVLGVGQEIDDLHFVLAVELGGVRGRLLIGHGEFTAPSCPGSGADSISVPEPLGLYGAADARGV